MNYNCRAARAGFPLSFWSMDREASEQERDRWAHELNGIGVAVFILDTFTGRENLTN